MSAGRSSAALLLGALVLAGCPTQEPDTRPFHIAVEVDGVPIVQLVDAEQLVRFTGTALREDDVTLFVPNAILDDGNGTPFGDVRITFDRSALADLAFPERFAGEDLIVILRASPEGRGPTLEPLPVPGIRILSAGDPPVSQFILWEGTYMRERGARVLSPAGISDSDTVLDFPGFYVEEQYIESEPGKCGLVYYDNLIIGNPSADSAPLAALLREERTSYEVGTGLPPWNVAHVVSWHRDGTCDDQSTAWTQFAAWRAPPP